MFLCLKNVSGGSDGKESACHATDLGLISGLGRSPGGGHVHWCNHCAKQHGGFPKKLKREVPYGPAIPLLVYIPKKITTLICKDTSTPVFIIALFMINCQDMEAT